MTDTVTSETDGKGINTPPPTNPTDEDTSGGESETGGEGTDGKGIN